MMLETSRLILRDFKYGDMTQLAPIMDVCKIALSEKLGPKFQDRIPTHNIEKCVYVY